MPFSIHVSNPLLLSPSPYFSSATCSSSVRFSSFSFPHPMRRRRRTTTRSTVRSSAAVEDSSSPADEIISCFKILLTFHIAYFYTCQRVGRDLHTLLRRFWKVAAPYRSLEDNVQARLKLAVVFALTFGTTGISVGFKFLVRDFYNSLANKDQEQFMKQLNHYLGAFAGGILAHLYSQIEAVGITYISIGNRRTLYNYHNKVLHLSFDSGNSDLQNWHFESINQFTTREEAKPAL